VLDRLCIPGTSLKADLAFAVKIEVSGQPQLLQHTVCHKGEKR